MVQSKPHPKISYRVFTQALYEILDWPLVNGQKKAPARWPEVRGKGYGALGMEEVEVKLTDGELNLP